MDSEAECKIWDVPVQLQLVRDDRGVCRDGWRRVRDVRLWSVGANMVPGTLHRIR